MVVTLSIHFYLLIQEREKHGFMHFRNDDLCVFNALDERKSGRGERATRPNPNSVAMEPLVSIAAGNLTCMCHRLTVYTEINLTLKQFREMLTNAVLASRSLLFLMRRRNRERNKSLNINLDVFPFRSKREFNRNRGGKNRGEFSQELKLSFFYTREIELKKQKKLAEMTGRIE